MPKKQYCDLKSGEKIKLFNELLEVKKVEISGKGVKQGKAKCRIEAINEKGEQKIVIRIANEQVEFF